MSSTNEDLSSEYYPQPHRHPSSLSANFYLKCMTLTGLDMFGIFIFIAGLAMLSAGICGLTDVIQGLDQASSIGLTTVGTFFSGSILISKCNPQLFSDLVERSSSCSNNG